MSLFHEQYESDGRLVLFRCKECGYTSMSLGDVHGHCEKHRGYTRFNIQIPLTKTWYGNVSELMELTELLKVDDTTSIELDEVDNFGGVSIREWMYSKISRN